MTKASTIKIYEAKLIPSAWKRPTKKEPTSIATPSEEVKKQVLLLSIRSTQLCKAIGDSLSKRDELDEWISKGAIPEKVLKAEWEIARNQKCFRDMPSRFQTTALLRIQETFSGWFEQRKQKRREIDRSQRWLDIVKSDAELMEISGLDIEDIKAKALEILQEAKKISETSQAQPEPAPESCVSEEKNSADTTPTANPYPNQPYKSVFSILFEMYEEVVQHDLVATCAISHLLKNRASIATETEDTKAFEARIRKKKKEVERLKSQLNSRLPRFRVFSDQLLPYLFDECADLSKAKPQIDATGKNIPRKHSDLPYSVLFYSRDDITWELIQRMNPNSQVLEDRIFIKIKGLDKYVKQQGIAQPAVFEICCDVRQLSYFKRCHEEWQLYSKNRNDYSTRDFLLQSASLVWKKKNVPVGQRKSSNELDRYEPYLQITIDTDKLTFESSEKKRLVELEAVERIIASYEAKQQDGELTIQQQKGLQRSLTTRRKLESNSFPRPSKPLYQGNQNLVLGVSFGLEKPVAVAIVDLTKEQTITVRSAKQFLGANHNQLSAYRHEQRHNSSQRRKNQRQRKSAEISEHRRGMHIDRVMAKAIVNLAQEYKAGLIVLADCKGIRDRIQSGIEAKAEHKYSKDIERQKAYLKQYRVNVHKWDFRRLSQCIRGKAGKEGIPVEIVKQPYQGDLPAKAAQVAFDGAKVLSS